MRNDSNLRKGGILLMMLAVLCLLTGHASFGKERALSPIDYQDDHYSFNNQRKALTAKLQDDRQLFINRYVFDPLKEDPELPSLGGLGMSADVYKGTDYGYYIVQYDGKILPEWFSALEATGVDAIGYLPNNAYIIKATMAQRDDVRNLPHVRWTGAYHPAYKINPLLYDKLDAMVAKGGTVSLVATTYLYEPILPLQPEIYKISGSMTIRKIDDMAGKFGWMIFDVPAADVKTVIARLAHLPTIQWIEQYIEPVLNNDNTSWHHQSGQEDVYTCFDNGLIGIRHSDGERMIYAACDSGIDTDACQMRFSDSEQTLYNTTQPPDVLITNPNNKIITYYLIDGANPYDGNGSHGTGTTGVAVGDNFETLATEWDPGIDRADGMSPGSQIVFCDGGAGAGILAPNAYDMLTQAWGSGAWVQNNSYGGSAYHYDWGSVYTDTFHWENQWLCSFWSAGNEGPATRTLGGAGTTAKNSFSVGANAAPNFDASNMTAFSSHGPTSDLRFKPDLTCVGGNGSASAYGNNQTVPPDDTCDYDAFGGTSASSPRAAGLTLLVQQYFMDGYYPTGAPNNGDEFWPTLALSKAVMINSCWNMEGKFTGSFSTAGEDERTYGPRPNHGQGWGQVRLDDALFFPGDHRDLMVFADIKNDAVAPDPDRPAVYRSLQTGDTHTYTFMNSTHGGEEPLKITLFWNDPVGPKGINPTLVNNLDLVVTDPLGQVFNGNMGFENGWSNPDDSQTDLLNHVECVYIERPANGVYTLEVLGTDIPGNGVTDPYNSNQQGYSLVATGHFSTAAGALAETQGWEYGGGRDSDEYLDIGETGTLGVYVVNTGLTATISPTTATVTVDPASEIPASSVTISPGSRNYGSLASGASAVRPFSVTLLNNLGSVEDYKNKSVLLKVQVNASNSPVTVYRFELDTARNNVEVPLFNFESGLQGVTTWVETNGEEPSGLPAPALVTCDNTGGRPTPATALQLGARGCESLYGDQEIYYAQLPELDIEAYFEDDEAVGDHYLVSFNFWHRYNTEWAFDWCQVFMQYDTRFWQQIAEYQGPDPKGEGQGRPMDEMVKEEINITFNEPNRTGPLTFWFRLITDEALNTELGWIIDDISITGVTFDPSTGSSPVPTITAADPSEIPKNKWYVPIEFTGTGFMTGAIVDTAEPGVTVHGTLVDSETELACYVSFDDTVTTGFKSFTVTNPDNQTGDGQNVINVILEGGCVVVGPGPGETNPNQVKAFAPDGTPIGSTDFAAYDYNGYGTKVDMGDINNDGTLEIITGPGPGNNNAPWVKVWQGGGTMYNHGADLQFTAYGVLKWGVNIGPAQLDDDPFFEIVTAPGPGKQFGPHVRGWDTNGSEASAMTDVSFIAYGTKKWGCNVKCGDVDGDGYDEILTGAGPGAVFGPHIRGWNFDNGTLTAMSSISYFAYGTSKYGSNVALGDTDGDGFAEIVTGAGPGAVFGPHVRGWNYDNTSITTINGFSFFAYGTKKFGVNVNCGDFDLDGYDELVTGPGPGEVFAPDVKTWNHDNSGITSVSTFRAWSQYKYGANVAAGQDWGY